MMNLKNIKTYLMFMCLSWSIMIQAQQSFTLAEAIDYALINNNSIKMQQLEIENSDYIIKETRAIGMPKVNGSIDYSYYFYTPKQPIADFITPAVYGILNEEDLINAPIPAAATTNLSFVQPHSLGFSIGTNMLLFDGTYLVALEAAEVYKDLAKKQIDVTSETVNANVTKAYLNVLIAELNKATLDRNIINLEKSVKEIKATYEAGFAESLDVDRLQLSYDQLITQSQNVAELIKLSYNLLKFQMGYDIESELSITQNIDDLLLNVDSEDSLENITIDPSKRATYNLLSKNQDFNQLDMKRYKKGYLPSVSAFANYQLNLQRTNLFESNEAGFLPTGVVGLSINVPIYDGGEKSAKIQQSRITIEKTALQQDEFIRGMKLEVNNAIVALQNAKRDLANRKKNMDMTQSIYDRTQIKFNEGVGSSVELTQAESSLYRTQAEYNTALYNLLESKVNLDLALGNKFNKK